MIKKFDQLEEGKSYVITHTSFSRNDKSHWANWHYYVYRSGNIPVLIGYYKNVWADDNWSGVVARADLHKNFDSLSKQLYKELDMTIEDKRIIMSVMRGALIYTS